MMGAPVGRQNRLFHEFLSRKYAACVTPARCAERMLCYRHHATTICIKNVGEN